MPPYHHPGTDLASAYELPFEVHKIANPNKEWLEFDGVFVMSLHFKKVGDVALQHVHDYDHATFVSRGTIRVHIGRGQRDYKEGHFIMIAKDTPHALEALEADSMCWCVHNSHLHPECLQQAKE